jgi:lysophospholipase L1-like esterase
MKIRVFPILALIALFVCASDARAQQKHAFYNDVQLLKEYDKQYTPIADPIVFVGSSSIRKWDYLQQHFGKYGVINRGVGGTVTNDIIFYAEDLIFKYKPRQVVIYVGENDVTQETANGDTVFNRFRNLYSLIRSRLPEVPVAYIALKPSPSREKFLPKVIRANELIRDFISKENNASFIDIYPKMLGKNRALRPELFVSDMLHMNADGYEIWRKAVKKHLVKPVKTK